MHSVSSILRIALGVVAAAMAALTAYWAMVVITFVLTWLLIALGVAAAAYTAYRGASSIGYDWLVANSAGLLARVRDMRSAPVVGASEAA